MTKQDSRPKYAIDAVPFEAFYRGSWHGVNFFSIKNGCISVQLNYHGSVIEDAIFGEYLRVRSRKASAFDCFHLLKIGVDVCVLSTHPVSESSDEEPEEPVLSWVDAKIISIKKNHNEGRCACQFSVVLNRNKNPTGFVNSASDKVTTNVVTIDRIAIYQKLYCEDRDDKFHYWTSSEDCTNLKKTKLLMGIVSSEVSWLIVYSLLKGMDFDIKLVQDRIVYHILNYLECSSKIGDVEFISDSEGIFPNFSERSIMILSFRKSHETLKPKIETFFLPVLEIMPTQNVEEDFGYNHENDESEVEILYDYVNLRRSKRPKINPERFTSYSEPNFNRSITKKTIDDEIGLEQERAGIASLMMNAQDPNQTNFANGSEMRIDELIEWNQAANSTALTLAHPVIYLDDSSESEFGPGSGPEPESESGSEFGFESESELPKKRLSGLAEDSSSSPQRESSPDDEFKHEDSGTRTGKGKPSSLINHLKPSWLNNLKRRKYPKRKNMPSSIEYKKLLEKFMESVEPEMGSQHDEGTESQSLNFIDESTVFKWNPVAETEVEVDEHEDLWKEMEDSLTTLSLREQKQKLDAAFNPDFFDGTTDPFANDAQQQCQHVFELDEQVGLTCQLCNYVCTEIRYVSPQMFQNDGLFSSRGKFDLEDLRSMGLYNVESNNDNEQSENYDNVWSSVSDLKSKLHSHQKRAFEFIWRNMAGSLHPGKMNSKPENTGGCVISHTPGSGKTLSVISFLVSYLRLYPQSRPLILAPNTAVHIWWKEFAKWGVTIPVHLIHPLVSYKKEIWDPKKKPCTTRRPNVQMMHVIDCLSKLKQWRESPSVLVMSYPAFFCFTYKESKYEYRKFMADILQSSPGILILDEGHNPRSTVSKLRKQLMKVNTDLRILLSGTLFQNNFEEYFNTLSLARPRFVEDVIRELDPRMNNGRKVGGRKITRKERLARKLFVEEIGQKIESENEEDRKKGFDLLNKTTSGFIDSHDGDMSDLLPGLQIYTVMLNSTEIQREIIMKLQNSMKEKRFHFELELLITVASIHPWLIKTVASVDDYFDDSELNRIEKYKKNFRSGSKLKFLVELVHKSSMRSERVLVFCHNIPPINFLVDLFDDVFGWSRGKEVLVLQGDQELFERARIMDRFNSETKNKCKVLLASTLACAEGISLTAASRVVLLDSEWNHAKTRQAIARAFRPGQKKDVYVYRLLALDTWEEDKYSSNEWKAWLSKMIFFGHYINFTCSKPVKEPEDEMLKELVDEDQGQTVQMVTKQD